MASSGRQDRSGRKQIEMNSDKWSKQLQKNKNKRDLWWEHEVICILFLELWCANFLFLFVTHKKHTKPEKKKKNTVTISHNVFFFFFLVIGHLYWILCFSIPPNCDFFFSSGNCYFKSPNVLFFPL